MPHRPLFWLAIVLLIAALGSGIWLLKQRRPRMNNVMFSSRMLLSSPAFSHNGKIPDKYTCRGQNVSPPLLISGVPAGTRSLALILHDPDAVSGDFTHWVVWNISPVTTRIDENSSPAEATQGTTDFGKPAYGGPCPPKSTGTHRYMFELYALKDFVNLEANANRAQLEATMQTQIVAHTTFTGLFSTE